MIHTFQIYGLTIRAKSGTMSLHIAPILPIFAILITKQ